MSAIGDQKLNKPRKQSRFKPSGSKEVYWAEISPESIRAVIVAVTATGCAIRFGYSRDKGAYAVGIVGDGEPYTIWAGYPEEIYIKLEALEQAFADG